jgi:hypothetical protein
MAACQNHAAAEQPPYQQKGLIILLDNRFIL